VQSRLADNPSFGDMTHLDWLRAAAEIDAGVPGGPFAVDEQLRAGDVSEDEAHDMVLSWLNKESM